MSVILGILLAIALAVLVTGLLLNKSNNKGDSKAKFENISNNGITYIKEENYIDKSLQLKDLS